MSTYAVQMEQVDYVVGEMNAISQKLHETLATLDSASRMNLQEWTSDAQATYQRVKAQWDSAADDMTAKAAAAATQLGTINEYYANGERQGVRLWG